MRGSFWTKLAGAAALVALADRLFFLQEPGWTLGLFVAAWTAVLAGLRPAVRRTRSSQVALGIAAAAALVLVDDPSPLTCAIGWTALAMAALLPRRRFDDALSWGARLLVHAITAPAILADLGRLKRSRDRRSTWSGGALVRLLGLPVAGTLLFVALFAFANPVLADALTLPPLDGVLIGHVIFWAFVLLATWPTLRPRRWPSGLDPIALGVSLPGASVASVTLSLLLFNLVFAVENALDIVFLWSGAALPDGMAMTDYVHRGAYPLVATALIAGLFVLATSRPGSETARSPLIRALLLLFVAQNLVLLLSSAGRTLVYVDRYMLTEWRIAALAWMALVGLGLVLILWRMWAGRSAAWLVNANALAAALVLGMASVVDLGAGAAAWNVVHAREAGGRAAALDLCYLRSLGTSALVPIARAEMAATDPAYRDRLAWLRAELIDRLEREQADWHSWTWRGSRRLAQARAIVGPAPAAPRPAVNGRTCMGFPAAPLTEAPAR